jgi:hypothetical protein
MTEMERKTASRPTTIEDGEYVAEDDSIIGRAFVWSLVVIGLVVVVVIAAILLLRGGDEAEQIVLEKDPGAITGLERETASMPQVEFADSTSESGIDFTHLNGAVGERMLPETMGGGVAFLDVDGDSDQDLLLINGSSWPWDETPDQVQSSMLYRNDGSGHFSNVTSGSGLDVRLYGMGVACGDYDSDDDPDVYITTLGENKLFRNDGGTFTDVTASSGVGGAADDWSTSAGFFDYDNDGDLDLMVCNYIEWSRQIDLQLNFTLNGTDRAYGPPTYYTGSFCQLYRNDGDGAFTDVSRDAGLHVVNSETGMPVGKSLALAPIDFDADGDMDVVVANDTTQNFLLENKGDGTFVDIGAGSGVAFDGMGTSTGAMGIDSAFYRNDDDLAVGIGNFANEMTSFYVRQGGSSQFSDDSMIEGIGSPSRVALSFGLFFFDYDLDGRLDLLQANGHLEEEINELQPSQHYRQSAQLFWNAGPDARSTFSEVPDETSGDLSKPIVGRGAAYADIDSDGDLDVVLTQTGGAPLLLRNEQKLGHHWLRVKLIGAPGNRDAIGAWVELTVDGATQRRQVMPTRSYLSQVELPITFGLGEATSVDVLRVRWPDGTTQEVDVDQVDREMVVEQGVVRAPA